MEEAYRDPAHEASFAGIDKLFHAARGKISRKKLKNWLEGVDAYTLHKPVRRKFKTRRVIVYSIDQQWQADLMDLKNLSKFNQGFNYLLVCIDILSKYAWAIPLKTKRGEEIVTAFQKIFSERQPKFLQTDKGTEFTNAKFQKFLRQRGVRFFTTNNTTKASIAERLIRTLRSKMSKYFQQGNTFNYVNVIDKLLESYNKSFHRSIGCAPVSVSPSNERDVWLKLYSGEQESESARCQLEPGAIVRISKHKRTFEKSSESNWSEELFIVTECLQKSPPVYKINDLLGETIEGTFYPQELQKVHPKADFPVEQMLKKRTRKGRLEYLVKFRGYPSKFNQWIPSSDMFSL